MRTLHKTTCKEISLKVSIDIAAYGVKEALIIKACTYQVTFQKMYCTLDNKKASNKLFPGHYIQSWRKFKDFSRTFQDCANPVVSYIYECLISIQLMLVYMQNFSSSSIFSYLKINVHAAWFPQEMMRYFLKYSQK